jgi:hypothetical protein
LIVNNSVTNYGIQDKSKITAPASTTPYPTQAPSVCGDVNGNGTIDIIDARLVAQYYVGLGPASFNAQQADVDASGTIDIVDALLIAKYYVELVGSLVCPVQ